MNYVEVAIPFFIFAMLVEYLYGKLVGHQTYRLNDTINSLQLGTLSRLVDVLRLGFSAAVFDALVRWIGLPQWSMESAWQWAAAFVAYDLCYYWKHRYGHEWRIMWASHIAHHQSEEFNLSTALRQTGTDYIGFVFYIPLYLSGAPASAVITVGSLNLIYQFWVHTEHIRRLGPLEWIFVTPSNHRVHHARNPEYIDKNYGGVFILWDRIFGTFKDERSGAPCVYGITTALKSWNPLWANLHFWADTVRLAWGARHWGDKVRIWFKPPSWRPADLRARAERGVVNRANLSEESVSTGDRTADGSWRRDYPKFDPPTTRFARVFTFVQFWAVLAGSLWLLKSEADLPRVFVLSAFAWICYAVFVQGAWLEGRALARALEWLGIALCSLLAGIAYSLSSARMSNVAVVLAAYGIASAVATVLERALRHAR
ncbi:MAG TPA: sterol desaturase family protein [Steroidobacter sp.]|nr:sterol desaturase family protein [Steroidobacter sp.]